MVGYQRNPLVFKGSPIDLLESAMVLATSSEWDHQNNPHPATSQLTWVFQVWFSLLTTIDESVYSKDFPNPELENHI